MQTSLFPNQLRYLLAIYIALGILYLFATPVLEAPDEIYHVAMINHVANTGELPVQRLGVETDYKQEGSQPPLYYLITGVLTRWIDRSDYDQLRYFNPHANIGQAELMGNKNRIIHIPTSAQNMVYVARFFSLLCGAITVFAVYQSARQFAPKITQLPLFATGLVIFNPQFLFISTAANNDILVVMFNTLSLWLTLKTLREGFDTRRSVILSIFIALGTISKLSGLVMVIVTALTGLYVGIKRRDVRGLITLAVLMAGIWGILGAWWYIRNITLYDELLGTGMMLKLFGGRSALMPDEWIRTMLHEFGGLRWSYWAVFGWFNIITWKWIYTVIDLLSLVALVGFIPFIWKIRRDGDMRESTAIAGFMLTLGTLSFLSWTTQTTGSQGRLLFPFIAPASIFLSLGFMHLKIRPQWILAPLVIFAVTQPIFIISPTYAKPPIIEALPNDAIGVGATFGDIELVGYRLDPQRWNAGDEIPITLYWRPLTQSPEDYTLAITAVLPDLSPIASINTYPGWGSLSTTTWATNGLYADTYWLRLIDAPSLFGDIRLLIRWWNYPDGDYLANTTSGDIFLFAGGINSAPPPELPNMTTNDNIIFANMFRLVGYTLVDNTLSLLWEVVTVPDNAYTVFAFALADSDNGRVVVAQGDNIPPMSTQYYRVGERFLTVHEITPVENADSGTYPLYIGWYRENTRLSFDAPDNMYTIGEIILP
ncbi:MAG: glycosyltransferase family 39 protein [bacterium]|nr:glycosyltransferase family 39 protein [bacterium]